MGCIVEQRPDSQNNMRLKSSFKQQSNDQRTGFLDQYPKLLLFIVISLFLVAAGVRLYRLQAPGLLPERDYGSAILARELFYRQSDTAQSWQRQVSSAARQNVPVLEPPITETVVSYLYRVVGSEQIWMARVLTSLFWLIGGIFLYKIAKMLFSTDAAVVATAFYLLAPLSVLLSRSFQPDALMMLLYLISLYAILVYFEQPSHFRLIIAGAVTGLTLLNRPIVLFVLYAGFVALTLAEHRSWKGVFRRSALIFFALSLLPSFLYYGYGFFFADYTDRQAMMSFQPYLFLRKEYWTGWLTLGLQAVGITALVAALMGMTMLPQGRPRAFLTGLWFGYLLFGVIFTYHIHTHGYYHAQLIPIVALSSGPLVDAVGDRLGRTADSRYLVPALTGIVLLATILSFRQVRSSLGNQLFEDVETAKEIGELVNHSSQVVYIARNYGVPLQYYGELSGTNLPRKIATGRLYQSLTGPELSVGDRLNAIDFSPEYFVITDFSQFKRYYADFEAYLNRNCSLLAESDKFLIYARCVG